ncbi:MAG: sigma-70 family RNA polymerase sigma factor [Verrucomicrobia bacterium]|jgi:RNA polymerase sigma-70 factor (ECF subfamily)|nr:sigma-70 family RNA polymerase sigma factor [Verrucomicrobiota bacterium]
MKYESLTLESERELLRRYVRENDPEVFSLITRLYAGVVYGACLRITGDPARAADAAQETFFHLARNARRVTGSLAGWLHRVAVGKAVDLIRSDVARRRREQEYAALPRETDQWADISPLVDEALQDLDAESRDVLVRHYLQGETLTEIAAAKDISQPTASRRHGDALEQLRGNLRAKGVVVSAAVLVTLMAGAASTAPAAVLAELGKMALASSGAAAGATATAVGMKVTVAVVAAAAGVGGWMVYQANRPADSSASATEPPPVIQQVQPALVETVRENTALAVAPASVSPASVTTTPRTAAAESPAQATKARGGFGGGAARGSDGWQVLPNGARMGGMARSSSIDSNPATPTGALNRFALALSMAAVRPERLGDCFVPGSEEFAGFQRMIQSPETDEERALQQCLLSLSAPVEVIETTPTDDGLRVKWRARVTKEFSQKVDGVNKQWQRGDPFELEVRLKQVGAEWRIAGF